MKNDKVRFFLNIDIIHCIKQAKILPPQITVHIFCGDFKNLKRRTASDKILRDKAFNIAKNPKYGGYQRGLASMVYKFSDKKLTGSGVNIPLEFNEQLAKELHKQVIRKSKKRKVYSGFIARFKKRFHLIKMSQYFPKPYELFGGNINVKVDLWNYATKADIKKILHIDTSSFTLKTNLATLKTEVDKLYIDKLVPVPVDLSKLS